MGLLSPVYAGVVYLTKEPQLQYSTSAEADGKEFIMGNEAITQMETEFDKELTEVHGERKDRDAIVGWDKRAKKLEAVKKHVETMDKEIKDLNESESSKEMKKALVKQRKKLKAIGREFGLVDSAAVVNGVLHIGISVGGGAIAAKSTGGDYYKMIGANVAGCTIADATMAIIEKKITGQLADEGWKRWSFKAVKFTVRVGGAAGISAGTSYLLKVDPITGAVTAAGTQILRMGLEALADVIMQW